MSEGTASHDSDTGIGSTAMQDMDAERREPGQDMGKGGQAGQASGMGQQPGQTSGQGGQASGAGYGDQGGMGGGRDAQDDDTGGLTGTGSGGSGTQSDAQMSADALGASQGSVLGEDEERDSNA